MAKVETRGSCTRVVCTCWPKWHCEPTRKVLRREPTGVASFLKCVSKMFLRDWLR